VKNGQAEQMHHTVMDQECTIHSSLDLPSNMCGGCMIMSEYVKNRTPTQSKLGTTPFEAYYG